MFETCPLRVSQHWEWQLEKVSWVVVWIPFLVKCPGPCHVMTTSPSTDLPTELSLPIPPSDSRKIHQFLRLCQHAPICRSRACSRGCWNNTRVLHRRAEQPLERHNRRCRTTPGCFVSVEISAYWAYSNLVRDSFPNHLFDAVLQTELPFDSHHIRHLLSAIDTYGERIHEILCGDSVILLAYILLSSRDAVQQDTGLYFLLVGFVLFLQA